MKLSETCQFLSELEMIPVRILHSPAEIQAYAEEQSLHRIQEMLEPRALGAMLASLGADTIVHLLDPFQVHFLFALCKSGKEVVPVVYGPYTTELLSREESAVLLSRLHITDLSLEDFSEYRGRISVRSQGSAQYSLSVLLSRFGLTETLPRIVLIDQRSSTETPSFSGESSGELHSRVIRRRYQIEQDFIRAISKGNRHEAVRCWHALHRSIEFRKLGNTLEISRISAAVTRTMVRAGAIQAGLPADLNDALSRESSVNISRARSIDAINEEHERMIHEYCQIIHRYIREGYSSLVLSALYMIEHQFSEDIHSEQIAKELDVSPSYLSHRFKAELGMPPGQYLNHIRMQYAAKELSQSRKPIQSISESCGILDANYFVKCFRKEYGMTPRAYRQRFQQ